jgi:mannose/cellobiose epimerase-like protein (N-acyl-D-glucosamine 2-epimerase family)
MTSQPSKRGAPALARTGAPEGFLDAGSEAASVGRVIATDIDAERSLARLKRWVVEDALPLWGETGFDSARGSFVERLTFEGAPVHSAPRRAMVQARQIYVFSHAALLGWRPRDGAIAVEAAHRLIDRYHGADGGHGWVFSVHPDGAIHDAKRDFYAHSFALFGLAWAYKLAPEPRFLAAALSTLSVLDQHFESPTGGYHSVLPADAGKREQNPHMHLFEAMLAWFEATGREMFLARAAELYGMMAARFFQPETGILAEYFDGAWNPREGIAGRICEPGHHFEWSWLLRRYARLSGRGDSPIARALKAFGDRHGFDARGFVVDELLDDGRVHKPSRRCWPHTEAIKAEVAAAEIGDSEAAPRAAQTIDRLLAVFLGRPVAGGWIDHIDATGAPIVDAMPASTLYHVFLAAAEADRLWGRRETLGKLAADKQ